MRHDGSTETPQQLAFLTKTEKPDDPRLRSRDTSRSHNKNFNYRRQETLRRARVPGPRPLTEQLLLLQPGAAASVWQRTGRRPAAVPLEAKYRSSVGNLARMEH
jgi:hypothetical protein